MILRSQHDTQVQNVSVLRERERERERDRETDRQTETGVRLKSL